MLESDRVCRFLLDERPVRGQTVRLEASWSALLEHADYPPAVKTLLGEAVVASVLLAATLKFKGALTVQVQGNGRVSLLVAQCTHEFRVRAMAQFDAASSATGFRELVGDGSMAVTVEAEDREARYQGVVPLAGESLAESLEAYFDRSEQIPSVVRLTAAASVIAGVLVQRLPLAGAEDAALDALWRQLTDAVHDLPSATVLEPSAEVVVRAAMAGEDARLFTAQSVEFECRCSAERVAALLRGLGEQEVRDVLAEEGAVTVTCEFCHRPYAFDSIEVEQLFASVDMAPGTDSIN